MTANALSRRIFLGATLLLCFLLSCMGCLAGFSEYSMRSVQRSQQAHAESFVPAKRLTTTFEREILNARIFFIYYVTIQKPKSLTKGWMRYSNAQSRLEDLTILVNEHEELANLRQPVAKLHEDMDAYGPALLATLNMVQSGVTNGPVYDAQVKEWAAKGAVLVTDAGNVESLCFSSGEASTRSMIHTLYSASNGIILLFLGSVFLSLMFAAVLFFSVKNHIRRRLGELLVSTAPPVDPSFA